MTLQQCSYEFNVGDTVITTDGIVGTIVGFCDCEDCRKRGFNEPVWENDENVDFITDYSAKTGFKGFHRIGKYTFHPFEREDVTNGIERLERELAQLRKQLATIDKESGVTENV